MDVLHTVRFKVSGFESDISPLGDVQSRARMAFAPAGGTQALKGIEPSLESQYLYYWSFNDETLEPDIAVDEVGAGIAFEANNATPSFVNGIAGDSFVAGRALRITGAQSLVIRLPMTSIETLTDLAFDIKSSDTGPKDFSLAYSLDGGITYEVLSASNQFEKTKDSQWNRYVFDVSGFSDFIGIEVVQFRLDFLPGNRGEGGEYNESSGIVHLDNIRLSGVFNAEVEPVDPLVPNKLHYYIFSSIDGSIVAQKELAMAELDAGSAVAVKLAEGLYNVVFVAYRSDKGILLPEALTNANEFYFGQHFDDHQAVTYAVLLEDLEVGESDTEAAIALNRCYSLVEFDFTDLADDLQAVKEIVVTKDHDSYLYTPFGTPASRPVSDTQSITFSGFDAAADYRITLHQFFGLVDRPYDVNYELTAYGADSQVLNVVTISESVTNNIRLLLTGRLLGNSGAINGFSVVLDTDWEEVLEKDF